MSRCPLFCTFEGEPLACVRCGLPPRAPATTTTPERNETMPATYKPRTRLVDAGPFCFEVRTLPDGSVSVAITRVDASAGAVQTVAYLDLPAGDEAATRVLSCRDAYDGTNRVDIAPGGGRPTWAGRG
jgi:hypothetical protein